MKKCILSLVFLFVSVILLTGCDSKLTYTFNVETGDRIKISLDNKDTYSMNTKSPISFTKDGEEISTGTFLTSDGYTQYADTIKNTKEANIIESDSKDGITYMFYSYNNEYNYLIKIDDSNTGFLLGNKTSLESAKEVFQRITITLDK